MYNEYFGLRQAPFSIAPNPQYLYMSERHREALAHLLYGIKGDGGFILLTGEVGTGKTTVCRCLLEQIPDQVDTAFILNPKLTAIELLATTCDEFGVSYPENASIKVLVDCLFEYLLASLRNDRRTVLIIDEAQNLSTDVLEQLRLLTNLETNQRKLLQIILLGQPELLDMLAKQELRQLSQRVTARFHLDALKKEEVYEYISHRLSVAGTRTMLFPKPIVNLIYKKSAGIPRVINLICDRALLGTYVENRPVVTRAIVRRAANEVLGETSAQTRSAGWRVAGLVMALLVVAFGWYFWNPSGLPVPTTQAGPATENQEIQSAPPPLVTPTLPDSAVDELQSEEVSAERVPATDEITRASTEQLVELQPAEFVIGHAEQQEAYTDLFALWGVNFADTDSNPCTQALTIGLRCASSIASLAELQALNRPVIVKLNDSWLVLSALDDSHATLIAGQRQFEVDPMELIGIWDGSYALLWRTPPGYEHPLTLGEENDTIAWIRESLNGLDGDNSLPVSRKYDDALLDKVKKYQLSMNLRPDGIVGLRTFVHINTQMDQSVPRLAREN